MTNKKPTLDTGWVFYCKLQIPTDKPRAYQAKCANALLASAMR